MSLIKFFESTDAGAPTLNNAVGSMIAVLDACLITGYNSKSITSITVASGVATVVCTAHAYTNTYGKAIRIAGATGSFTALNKDTQIANVTTNGFTFLCPGVADGAATGTLTAKYAPLDWTKQYSGTNKAMYKRGDVTATGCMLRIDDNAVGQSCRALMVQSATDIDTYTNAAPTQVAGGLGQYWSKGYNSAVAADWMVIADSHYAYVFVRATSTTRYMPAGFGDILDFKPSSVLGCAIAGGVNSTAGAADAYSGAISTGGSWVISGGKSGISQSQPLGIYAKNAKFGTVGPVYPSDVDGGLVIGYPALIDELTTDGSKRGILPGLAIPLGNISASIPAKTQITNIIGSVKNFISVPLTSGQNNADESVLLIDLTGPWRN